MKIYNVLWADRHKDTTATPFKDLGKAIAWARKQAYDNCNSTKDMIETPIVGWLFHVAYSSEGDCLWITEHKI